MAPNEAQKEARRQDRRVEGPGEGSIGAPSEAQKKASRQEGLRKVNLIEEPKKGDRTENEKDSFGGKATEKAPKGHLTRRLPKKRL